MGQLVFLPLLGDAAGRYFATIPQLNERIELTAPGTLADPVTRAFAIRGARPSVADGRVFSVGELTLRFPVRNTQEDFDWLNSPLYLEILDGPRRGETIDVAVRKEGDYYEVSSPEIDDRRIYPGIEIRIRQHWTVQEVFGSNNKVGLIAAAIPSASETLTITKPESGSSKTVFFSTVIGGWADEADPSTPAGPITISPGSVMLLTVKTPVERTVTLQSEARYGAARVNLGSGANLVSRPFAGIPRNAPVPQPPPHEEDETGPPAELTGGLFQPGQPFADTSSSFTSSEPEPIETKPVPLLLRDIMLDPSFYLETQQESSLFWITPQSESFQIEFRKSQRGLQ